MNTTTITLPLADEVLTGYLDQLPGWEIRHGALEKTFKFESFREALGFMVRVAFDAEALNHHPEWTNIYDRVIVRLRTHESQNQVTEKDIELARRIESVSWVD